jgi:hypothetical protein
MEMINQMKKKTASVELGINEEPEERTGLYTHTIGLQHDTLMHTVESRTTFARTCYRIAPIQCVRYIQDRWRCNQYGGCMGWCMEYVWSLREVVSNHPANR